MVDLSKIRSPLTWPSSRGKLEETVLSVLGPLPKERPELQVKTVDEYDFPGHTRRRVNYFVDPWTRVGAWLFTPEGKEEMPALICCHDRSPMGKDESAGISGDIRLAFAQRYAELGYVTLAPDCILAGERITGRAAPFDSTSYYKDATKLSVAGKMLTDHIQAVGILMDAKRVDSARIGVIGHGLGAFNAILLAAFDNRIQSCVAINGFTRFDTDKEPQRWVDDDGLSLMPKLKPMIEAGSYAFDWEHILALAAPSPTLIISSLSDSIYSNPKSCQKAVSQASRVYKALGAANALDQFTHHDGHRVTPETMEISDDWFERWL